MKTAKPLLLVMTPIGVGWGLVEAARFHWWLAALMAVLLGVIGLFIWSVVRRIRAERESDQSRRIRAERESDQSRRIRAEHESDQSRRIRAEREPRP